MQSRGPYENGWQTSRLSLKNGEDGSFLASGSQRSGIKLSGSWKFKGDVFAAIWWTPTFVCSVSC